MSSVFCPYIISLLKMISRWPAATIAGRKDGDFIQNGDDQGPALAEASSHGYISALTAEELYVIVSRP